MESLHVQNLNIEELQHGAGPSAAQSALGQQPPAMQAVPQLPPQMFTTAAQLLDLTDKKILAWLRDGKKVFGMLRSWDQFGKVDRDLCS